MPNWCENEIKIFGNEEKMKPIVEVFQNVENNDEFFIMETLLGIDDRPSDYNEGGWYNYNVNKFGTKWDFCGKDCEIIELDKDIIWFRVLTAWSPPSNFLDFLCSKYGVSATNVCFEPGSDVGGYSEFYYDKPPQENFMSYLEAMYKYNTDFWDEVAYRAQEYIVDGGNTDFEEFAKDYTFIPKEHLPKLRDIFDNTYERLKDELL